MQAKLLTRLPNLARATIYSMVISGAIFGLTSNHREVSCLQYAREPATEWRVDEHLGGAVYADLDEDMGPSPSLDSYEEGRRYQRVQSDISSGQTEISGPYSIGSSMNRGRGSMKHCTGPSCSQAPKGSCAVTEWSRWSDCPVSCGKLLFR